MLSYSIHRSCIRSTIILQHGFVACRPHPMSLGWCGRAGGCVGTSASWDSHKTSSPAGIPLRHHVCEHHPHHPPGPARGAALPVRSSSSIARPGRDLGSGAASWCSRPWLSPSAPLAGSATAGSRSLLCSTTSMQPPSCGSTASGRGSTRPSPTHASS